MFQEILEIYEKQWPTLLERMLEHIRISGIAILIAGTIGLILGIAVSRHKRIASVVMGIINVVYTIPSISMLGFLLPFTGIGPNTAIIALSVYGLLPMVRNTYTGITSTPAAMLEAARGMGSTVSQTLFKIRLPLALPVIMSGVRSMVVMTISLAGIAAYIGGGGLGVEIFRGINTNNFALTFASSILIAALALLMDFIISRIEKPLKKHRTL